MIRLYASGYFSALLIGATLVVLGSPWVFAAALVAMLCCVGVIHEVASAEEPRCTCAAWLARRPGSDPEHYYGCALYVRPEPKPSWCSACEEHGVYHRGFCDELGSLNAGSPSDRP